jgi:hypothetical protein
MDDQRQRGPQNASVSVTDSRASAVEALRQAIGDQGGNRRPRLGDILVANGQITRDQLASALASQRQSGLRLGEELVAAGYVTRSVISRALRIQRRQTFAAMCSTVAEMSI